MKILSISILAGISLGCSTPKETRPGKEIGVTFEISELDQIKKEYKSEIIRFETSRKVKFDNVIKSELMLYESENHKQMAKGQMVAEAKEILGREYGTIVFESDPAEADVYINGLFRPAITTPSEWNFEAGSYQFEMRLANHKTCIQTIRVFNAETITMICP